MQEKLAGLKQVSVRGGLINIGSRVISIFIQLISTIVLSRLLSAEDYGVMAMVLTVTSFVGLFRDLGLSSAAVQKKELTHAQQTNLFWLNVAVGLFLAIVVSAVSPLVASFYKKPELTSVTILLSFNFLIGSFGFQSGAMLTRRLLFKQRAMASIAGSIITLVVTIVLAMQGFSYWSLVWGNILGSLGTTVLLYVFSPFIPGWPRKKAGVREMLKFGAYVTGDGFATYFHRNLDNILIGKVWGMEALGLYSRAYHFLMLPFTSIHVPLHMVAFPVMSSLQNEPKALKDYYLKTVFLIALLSMPVAGFFFVAAEPIVEVVLGQKWKAVAPIFSCLALAALIQPVSSFASSILLSTGKGRRYLECGVFTAIMASISFLIGIHWGPIGVATAYVACNYLIFIPLIWRILYDSPVKLREFIKACTSPALASLLGCATALTAKSFFGDLSNFPLLLVLALSFIGGVSAILLLKTSRNEILLILTKVLGTLAPKKLSQ